MRTNRTFWLGIMASIGLLSTAVDFAGCDGAVTSQYQEQLVVNSFIFAGEPMDSVVLHRTTPFGAYYDDLDYAVDSATVVLSVDGVEHTLQPGTRKGRYYLPAADLTIEGGRKYDLRVTASNNQTGGVHLLHAVTEVPMPIKYVPAVDSFRGQTLVLDTNRLIDFQYLVSAGPIDEPNRKYLLSVTALDTLSGRIRTSLEGPPTDTLATVRYSFVQSGPVIGISPRLFGYFGANLITFYAIDTNWVDYQRQVQNKNSSYQPSLNHVDGGMGVFASGARDTVTVFIKPKD